MILPFYIIRNHIVPFLFSAITLMGIFLLQFLMKAADRLVGKGLDTWVLVQLVSYNLAWMVVLVIPMAVLIATLMAFGTMSQNNEITIMKSTGVSLYKMMAGPLMASVVVAYLLLLFNNDVLPDANHEAKLLMFDISQKKPTLSLQPGVFSQEVNNYAILVRNIDQKTNNLNGVTIYDYTNPSKMNIVTANQGKIYFSPDLTKLIMDLQNGEIHETEAAGTTMYRKILFTRHRIAMNADQFSFQKSNDNTRGDRELSTSAMIGRVDSLKKLRAEYFDPYANDVKRVFLGDAALPPGAGRFNIPGLARPKYTSVVNRVQTVKSELTSSRARVDFADKEIHKYMVEIHKKYSIPFACIVFILLGAPLGIMIRKGGFGMAGSISLFFFLIYWAFLIGGEKLADRGFISPFWGMWAANVIMGTLGLLLTYRSAKETVTLEFGFVKKLIPKHWRSQEE
jgi:lipopolysaccharide export system permease protein